MRYPSLVLTILLLAATIRADEIAVLYALDADLQTLRTAGAESGSPAIVGGRSIHRLAIGPHSVYAIKMGSGAVETCASAQALLTRFRCDRAFSVGPAGSLSDDLSTGAWVRVTRVIAWQRGTAGATGFQLSNKSQWDLATTEHISTNFPNLFANAPPISLASGEEFVASDSERANVRAIANADAIDMNTFGLALVCADHHVPLRVWRIISDRANEHAAEDFLKFVNGYDGAGGRALAELIKNLPPNLDSPQSYPAIEKLLREK